MDVAGIRPGFDFRQAIEDNVASCGVLLAIVGPVWVSIANASGQRRLDDPNDFVALEIASALKRQVPVIPVLVHEARMPAPEQLPESLKSFAYRNSVELSHTRWNSDVQRLVEALTPYVTPTGASPQDPVHATIPVQLPPPHPAAQVPQQTTKRSNLAMILGIASVALLAIGTLLYFKLRPDPEMTALVGTWKEPDRRAAANSLDRLVIDGAGSSLSMHAYGWCRPAGCDCGTQPAEVDGQDATASPTPTDGSCQPTECDWGTQPVDFDGENAKASFIPTDTAGTPDAIRTASVHVRLEGNNLDVNVHNKFKEQDGFRDNKAHRVFVPVP